MLNGWEDGVKASDEKVWQPTAVQNLVRYAPSGTYFARFRVGEKFVWNSLKTATFPSRNNDCPTHCANTVEDRIVDRVCRREDDGRQCCGCLPAENTREHITQAEIKRIP